MENTFENAISQINEELGKLAAMGQTQWIDKLNCIVAVKEGSDFSITSCGKVSAYLLRGGELTDISCSQTQSHPLKTFENFAVGKIRLGDLILLSTAQLFNYVSMDRLLNIFGNTDFLTATQTVIQLLKENAEPQISFGTLLNLQVPEGETPGRRKWIWKITWWKSRAAEPNFASKSFNYVKTAFATGKAMPARLPKVGLPNVSLGQKIKNFSGNTKNFVSKSKGLWQFTKSSAKTVKNNASNLENFKQLSSTKKFFLASAIILFIAVAANIGIAVHLKKVQQTTGAIALELGKAQTPLARRPSFFALQRRRFGRQLHFASRRDIPDQKNVDKTNKNLYTQVLAQLNDLQTQMEKIFRPPVTNLGSLGAGNNLIKLPDFVATQANSTISATKKARVKSTDEQLKLNLTAQASVYLKRQPGGDLRRQQSVYLGFFLGQTFGAGFRKTCRPKRRFWRYGGVSG